MHLLRHTRPLLAALVLALVGSTATAAASVAGTTLPLAGFSHMVVDGAHGHVFLTGAAADSKIVVRNTDGTAAGTITSE
jgi:predicted regulator of Ras-like GTPase activity (Roadblock/LC7/MglB family)